MHSGFWHLMKEIHLVFAYLACGLFVKKFFPGCQKDFIMALKQCSKCRNGEMIYDIDYEAGSIRLVKDLPEHGNIGASFDASTAVSMSDIFKAFDADGHLQPWNLYPLFRAHSVNNAPMLTAALLNEGIINREHSNKYRKSTAVIV